MESQKVTNVKENRYGSPNPKIFMIMRPPDRETFLKIQECLNELGHFSYKKGLQDLRDILVADLHLSIENINTLDACVDKLDPDKEEEASA